MAKDFGTELFNNNGIEEVHTQIYGGGLESVSKSVRARAVDLMEIRPDIAQPRRAIPLSIRGGWDGDPEQIEDLLQIWFKRTAKEFPMLDVSAMLTEQSETVTSEDGELVAAPLPDDLSPMAKGYIELVQLAADIRRVGLTNPITVARDGDGYSIIAGERRYLAHHLLWFYLRESNTIEAFIKPKRDVWAQASENAARSPLNAIGMARQVAILIMAMYEEQRGAVFRSYHELVEPGKSDRVFYAQVADGREYRVLEGYAERLTTSTGLPSYNRVRHYRQLLKIDDELWMEADAEDYSDVRIRQETNPQSQSVNKLTLWESEADTDERESIDLKRSNGSDSAGLREIPDDIGEDAYGHDTPAPDEAIEYLHDEIVPAHVLTASQKHLLSLIWSFVQSHAKDEYEKTDTWRWDYENLMNAHHALRDMAESDLPKERELAIFEKQMGLFCRELGFAVQLMFWELEDIHKYLIKRGEDAARGERI